MAPRMRDGAATHGARAWERKMAKDKGGEWCDLGAVSRGTKGTERRGKRCKEEVVLDSEMRGECIALPYIYSTIM